MSVCAKIVRVNGDDFLALDPTQTDLTACAFVVESGTDIANNFFRMSGQDGAVFSAGVVACWFVAYSCKTVINLIRGSSE